jgi:aryl-alcohol dehydrogenase-like predicted oxidoreductase
MEQRHLGTQGLKVSKLGLGCMNLSGAYASTPDEAAAFQLLNRAVDLGVNFFDTAEMYGPFKNELLVGRGLRAVRERVVIATKFGFDILPAGGRPRGVNSKPEHIQKVCESSLERLGVETIDLLYQHRVDPQVPIEDVAGAVKELMSQGKVLHWGLCEMGPNTLRRANATLPVTAVQNEYSMLWRGPEEVVIPICQELGIGFVCWSPLGVQFLTGAIDANTRFAAGDIRGAETRFAPDNLSKNLALVKLSKEWADRKNAAPGQIALAWLIAQKPWIVAIPGTTEMAHMVQNAGASSIVFTPEEFKELNAAVADIHVQGQRLPDGVLALSGVEAPPKS